MNLDRSPASKRTAGKEDLAVGQLRDILLNSSFSTDVTTDRSTGEYRGNIVVKVFEQVAGHQVKQSQRFTADVIKQIQDSLKSQKAQYSLLEMNKQYFLRRSSNQALSEFKAVHVKAKTSEMLDAFLLDVQGDFEYIKGICEQVPH